MTEVSQPEPKDVLLSRRWELHTQPFRHYQARDVFTSAFYNSLEAELRVLLAKGFSAQTDASRFSKNMKNSDAYGWNFPACIEGPLAFFFSRKWHDLLADLTGVPASRDVNAALHHHQLCSRDGTVHRDLGEAWFSNQERPDGINPMDLSRCSYTHGEVRLPDIERREMVRAVTMIFYFGNTPWKPGDGGETGLYRNGSDPLKRPEATVPPINNSLLMFENTPGSWHSFLENRSSARNSAILWLHRSKSDLEDHWRDQVSRW